MAVFKCKMCGGDLEIIEDSKVAECGYCGTKQTVPSLDNEKKISLFTRANKLRAGCEFDKAAGVYESIVAEFPEEAEAYWGLILCKYGIEYVDDPLTGKKIPTCHRSSFDCVLDSNDFEMVMENADIASRKVYREEAKTIEDLRRAIIEISGKEEPYDIFICYKETDEYGNRTIDSAIAQDVYTALTEKGYRVFFSRISLEDKLGQEYEPYIFAALNSARIMLAFGTDYEYYNAVWVKNEWSRYLQLIAAGAKKTLIPCYKNIDAYDMPREFAKLQAQDMGKVGAIQDLLRGIEKIITVSSPVKKEENIENNFVASATEPLLKRVFMFIADGEWDKAEEYCEKTLDIAPECGEAYLAKLMIDLKVRTSSELDEVRCDFSENRNYQKVVLFGDDETKNNLALNLKASEIYRKLLRDKRLEIAKVQNIIGLGDYHCVGVRTDGSVIAAGLNNYSQCSVSNWSEIIGISVGQFCTVGVCSDCRVIGIGRSESGGFTASELSGAYKVKIAYSYAAGLRPNGTVAVSGWRDREKIISRWTDISDIGTGKYFIVCLRNDGRVIVETDSYDSPIEKCDEWKNIISISCASYHVVGVQADGKVVAAMYRSEYDKGECNVSDWTDVVSVVTDDHLTLGLRSDGRVLATGDFDRTESDVSGWRDIVALATSGGHTVGLRLDGTVVATGSNKNGECNVSEWRNIVAVYAARGYTVGLCYNGTVVATGTNEYNQCNVKGWKLFDSFENFSQERKTRINEKAEMRKEKEFEALRTKQIRQSNGLCQYCGGEFKGLFIKRCADCGRERDY